MKWNLNHLAKLDSCKCEDAEVATAEASADIECHKVWTG